MADEGQQKSSFGNTLLQVITDFMGGFASQDPNFGIKRAQLMQDMEDNKRQRKLMDMKLKLMEAETEEKMKKIDFNDLFPGETVGTPPEVAGGVEGISPDVNYGVPSTEPQTKPGEFNLKNLFKGGVTVDQATKYKAIADIFKGEKPTRVAVPEKSRLWEFPATGGPGKEIVPAGETGINPLSDIGKLKHDRDLLIKQGVTEDSPTIKAIDAEMIKKSEDLTLTPLKLTAQELEGELGRKPTAAEIKERVKKEAKGYETAQEAFEEAQKMVKAAGPDAGLVASYELSPQNKYIPKTQPNITLRIPPFVQGQNLPPGIIFNRKTGKYSDTTTGKQFDRKELINLYGENAAISADKMALGELTKREQLIKIFTNRIDANVPIVLDAVKAVKNSNARLYNKAINEGKQYLVGSGKWTALQTAMMSLSNEVQRVESNQLGIGGQGTEDRKIWAKFHDPNMSFKDIEEVCNMIKRLSHTATKVVENQRNDLIKRIPTEGMGGTEFPSTPKGRTIKLKSGKTIMVED